MFILDLIFLYLFITLNIYSIKLASNNQVEWLFVFLYTQILSYIQFFIHSETISMLRAEWAFMCQWSFTTWCSCCRQNNLIDRS